MQDMDLIFYNCELYNGLTSQVGKHGTVVKRAWLKAWEQSGLDRSAGAGVNISLARSLHHRLSQMWEEHVHIWCLHIRLGVAWMPWSAQGFGVVNSR